jgi:hypothetical protein
MNCSLHCCKLISAIGNSGTEQLTLKLTMPGSVIGELLERLRMRRNNPSPNKMKSKSNPITNIPIMVKLELKEN